MIRFSKLQARKRLGIETLLGSHVIGGAIGAIGSLIGGKSASDDNLKAVRETNASQERMFQQQLDYNRAAEARSRQYALEDFEMENRYNSPAAQRARFEAAGLNPALMMGDGSAVGQMESTSVSQAPSAPQLTPPQSQDYISPAMDRFISGMIGVSQANKQAEEASGIAMDNRVKAVTERERILSAILANNEAIQRIKNMKGDEKIKQMELKNLESQNYILQDTASYLDMTLDGRVKGVQITNYLNDRMAAKMDEEYKAQKVSNFFAVEREKRNLKIQDAQAQSLVAAAVQAMTQAGVNREMAAYVACQKYGIDPKSEAGKKYYRALEIALRSSELDLGSAEFDYNSLDTPIGRFYRRIGLGIRSIIPVNVGVGLNPKR